MRLDIISGKIGERGLISIFLFFQHQDLLLFKPGAAEVPASEIQTEFKRHIHPVVLTGLGTLTTAQIMD